MRVVFCFMTDGETDIGIGSDMMVFGLYVITFNRYTGFVILWPKK